MIFENFRIGYNLFVEKLNTLQKNEKFLGRGLTLLSDNDILILLADNRKGDMKERGIGKRIFEESMETRITLRLDKKHLAIIEEEQKKQGFKTKSETIRYIIEQQKK